MEDAAQEANRENQDLFVLHPFQEIPIVSPAIFLNKWSVTE